MRRQGRGTDDSRESSELNPLLLGMESFADEPGGLNRYLRDLLAALSSRGVPAHSVVVGSGADGPTSQIQVSNPNAGLVPRLWCFARAAGEVAQSSDVVDAHFALYALVPTIFGRLRHIPLVVHFQGPWAQESAGDQARACALAMKWWIERTVYRRAKEAVVLSSAFKQILVERYRVSPWRVHVIPPGVDLRHFCPGSKSNARRQLGIADGAWVCLVVRRLVARMGIDVLLEAWRLLVAENEGISLQIAGEGPDRKELENKVRDLGLDSSVRFLGRLTESELVSHYRAADVCVVPSVALEGFGLVVLESLACGTPVVATEVGGLPEALGRLDASLVVAGGDVSGLVARLRAGIDGRSPFPDAARCRSYAEEFSWEAVAERNLEIYRQAVNPAPPTKLRVAYVDHCAELSGGELALARLLPALDAVEAHVVLAQDGPLCSVLREAGISVEVLPMAEPARGLRRNRVQPEEFPLSAAIGSAWYVVRLARRLRQLRPDLVHTNSLKSAVYGGVAARLANVPVVWHVRDRIASDYLPREAVRLVRVLARILPHAVIANSDATLATLPNLGDRARVIHSPIATTRRQPPKRKLVAGTDLCVGMVGRIAPWKGQHIFLEAFALAFPQEDCAFTARAIILGSALFGEEAYAQEVSRLASRLGLDGRVEWAGFVQNVGDRISGFDILVHASVIPEPFGQVVIQGMAAGVPVVAPRAGGPAEVIDAGVTGMLYPPGDARALAETLVTLAGDQDLRARLAEAGQAKAREFTPEAVAPRVMKSYSQALKRVRRSKGRGAVALLERPNQRD